MDSGTLLALLLCPCYDVHPHIHTFVSPSEGGVAYVAVGVGGVAFVPVILN